MFKRTISESPMQYLLKYRLMQSAAILLERPGESISDIAGACGFDYPSYYAGSSGVFTAVRPENTVKENNAAKNKKRGICSPSGETGSS